MKIGTRKIGVLENVGGVKGWMPVGDYGLEALMQ